ncbi:MHS family MFS transporter [Steroidobacter sp. S1-65]|uniref:MHS family MFS transporter n=1 Tax=Steroidobacter gossypii TaxID=2805490 RepID=A0ABS1WXN1_9GAMM|nr:MFS transporter [Steroidobacter gossypii]MBM0105735.1 MHS family MFS transporter [Steroidobacter gossypii]
MAERPATGRLATASIVGTTLEYYDFAVYNMLAALVFNQLFFPSFDPLSGTLLAFSTFAVGYLSRPVGGLIFGHLGDRYGRRFVLVATLLLMGITTALMGLLPTYASAGVASPIMLVVLRFVQGAALGGEWAGAVLLSVEHGDPRRRGRNASWAQMGPSLGTLLATGTLGLITWALSPDDFIAWGWRLPFFASVALVAFGLWIRVGVEETPLFKHIEQQDSKAQAPISEVLRSHWRSLLVGGGVRIGPDVLYSLSVAFALSYITTVLGESRTLALIALSIGGAINAFTIPLFGALSDRYGRRIVYGAGAVLGLIWMFAFFPLLETKQPTLIILAVVVALTVHAMMYGPQAAFIAEQFPTRVRYAGASLAYTLAGIVGGGIAPMVSTALLQRFGSAIAVSSYAAIASLITCLVLFMVRERAREQLD